MTTHTRTRLKDVHTGMHVTDLDNLIHIHVVVTADAAKFICKSNVHSTVGVLNHLGHLSGADVSYYNLALAERGIILLYFLTNLTAVCTNGAVVME